MSRRAKGFAHCCMALVLSVLLVLFTIPRSGAFVLSHDFSWGSAVEASLQTGPYTVSLSDVDPAGDERTERSKNQHNVVWILSQNIKTPLMDYPFFGVSLSGSVRLEGLNQSHPVERGPPYQKEAQAS